MIRTLIVGIDTTAGHSLAEHLAPRPDVSGLWFSEPEFINGCKAARVTPKSLKDKLSLADVIIFCGGAARSSWDADFGDFSHEQQGLNECIESAKARNQRLVYVSSDAVFSGPWVFHDDDSTAMAVDRNGRKVRKYESLVSEVPDSLIVRTNILDPSAGFVADSVASIRDGSQLKADAATFATPIDSGSFATALTSCLDRVVTGEINIAGAERLTPFHFLITLANYLNLSTSQIQPALPKGKSAEQSMRCDRLRNECELSAPLKSIVLEHLAVALENRSTLNAAA